MTIDSRHEWSNYVKEIQRNLEGNGTASFDDILIIRTDAYINSLELKLAKFNNVMDFYLTRTLSKKDFFETINQQLSKEMDYE